MFRSLIIALFLSLWILTSADAGTAILRPYRSETALVARGNLDQDLLSRLVLEETNRYRASKGRPPLVAMKTLMIAAQGHSDAMAENNFFAHKNPRDPSRRTLGDRMRRVGLNPPAYAENIALTFTRDFHLMQKWSKKGRKTTPPGSPDFTYRALAKSVVQQWVDSRGHRRNMLGSRFDEIGLGFATAPDPKGYERVYCVQTFAAARKSKLP